MKKKLWSPYIAGALVGLTLVLSVGLFGGWYGTTTTFARFGSAIVAPFTNMNDMAFFTDSDGLFSYHTLFNFQTFFVIGIGIGSFVSAKTSGYFKIVTVPELFSKRFGDSKVRRYIVAFIGGNIMVIGARFADGCTSWWGLSVGSKLDFASFATVGMFFLGAVITSNLFYGRKFIKGVNK